MWPAGVAAVAGSAAGWMMRWMEWMDWMEWESMLDDAQALSIVIKSDRFPDPVTRPHAFSLCSSGSVAPWSSHDDA